MNLLALPAFTDNYIWMFDDGSRAVVVDPGDAAPVRGALASRGLTLAGILVTHHHADHCGGIEGLRDLLEGPVFGPAGESIPQPSTGVSEGDRVEVLGLQFDVLDVPGHTAGHVAYVWRGEAPAVFCGDTLFSAGCGRLFEGTARQLHDSLDKLARIEGDARVCCGHEYTLSNLRFAQAVEPDNAAIEAHRSWCQARRDRGEPTLPSRIEIEREINPFLRCGQPAVIEAARRHGAETDEPVAVFAALRRWKDAFR